MAAGINRTLDVAVLAVVAATEIHHRGHQVHRCEAISIHHYRGLVRDDNQES